MGENVRAPNDSDERVFTADTAAYRAELRVHCYRMLGSTHDAEDLVQETLLRAWRARDTQGDPTRTRAWLYRIATNVCLDALKTRGRRALPSEVRAAADPHAPIAPPTDEAVWLEPLPGTWLPDDEARDPAARYAARESVALAFMTAIHALTPMQRATLLLREVVGFSGEETAAALGVDLAASNSALHRARLALDAHDETRTAERRVAHMDVDPALIARFVAAFEASDVDALVVLLRDDVKTTMPPSPTWIDGREANARFYATMFAARGRSSFRLVPTTANGQPAFAFYRRDALDAPHVLRAIEVIDVRGGAIARIDHFLRVRDDSFDRFDVPRELARA